MKKRILSMLMVLVLMGVMIGGCGKETVKQPENTDVIASVEKEVSTETEETTNEVETTEKSTEQPTDEVATQPEETPPTEVTPEPTEEVTEPVETAPQFTFTDLSQTMYAANSVNVRDLPSTDGKKLGGLSTNQEVAVTGQCNETGWYRISYNGGEAFVSDKYLVTEKVVTQPVETTQSGGEVAQQPVEETQPEQPQAPAENPYPLYTVIDEGGTNVYFYFLYDGTAARSEAYWDCEDQCINILNERNGISRQADGWYSGAGSQETNYYVDGKQVVKALPVTGISVE